MNIRDYIGNKKLIELLDEYLGDQKIGTNLLSIAEGIGKNDLIIPVLGVQGMGKSTLLNAVLAEDILPNEADETTCVPVEIRYGTEEGAAVHFLDESEEPVRVMGKDDLAEYVDNTMNPGNEKRISHIVLYRQMEILKRGMVLVDLPGVGSLTAENHATTMNYIQKLCTAIFLIPTTPTIRRYDAAFIKNVWSMFNTCLFVQNPFDEQDDAIEESVTFNRGVLKNISKEINVPYDGRILVVNAYDAAVGRIYNKTAETERSNIRELLEYLDEVVKNRTEKETDSFLKRVEMSVTSAKKAIRERMDQAHMSESELQSELDKNERIFRSEVRKIKRAHREIADFLEDSVREFEAAVGAAAETAGNSLRADMHKVIDGGVVDGELLTTAFVDNQKDCAADLAEAVLHLQNELLHKIGEKIAAVTKDIEFSAEEYSVFEKFALQDKVKFEKGLNAGIDAIIAVLGVWALAIPVPVFNFIVSIAIELVGPLIGRKVRKLIVRKRGTTAKQAIEKPITDFINGMKKHTNEVCRKKIQDIRNSIDGYHRSMEEYQQKLKEENSERIRNRNEDIEDTGRLENDLEFICSVM